MIIGYLDPWDCILKPGPKLSTRKSKPYVSGVKILTRSDFGCWNSLPVHVPK